MADPAAARRLRLALDMYAFGERMQRARLRRELPDAMRGPESLVRLLLMDGYRLLASIEQDATGRLAKVCPECPATSGDDEVIC